jgi:hypothetical protein
MRTILRYNFAIIIFIGLKFWELLKYIGNLSLNIFEASWKPLLGALAMIGGFFAFIFGFGYIIIWQYELLGGAVHEGILIIVNAIVIALAVKFGKYIYDYWDYEVKPFILGNWNKAKRIAESIV